MPRTKKVYSPEYREEAVTLVIETSRPIVQVAKELGLQEGTLGNWVNTYRRQHVSDEPDLTVTERARPPESSLTGLTSPVCRTPPGQ